MIKLPIRKVNNYRWQRHARSELSKGFETESRRVLANIWHRGTQKPLWLVTFRARLRRNGPLSAIGRARCLLALALVMVTVPVLGYGPDSDKRYPREVYWGDTHVHTSFSSDAYLFGDTTLDPRKAYQFARGEVVTTTSGLKARLAMPLDFLVVADHAENLGMMNYIEEADRSEAKSLGLEKWFDALKEVRNTTGGFSQLFQTLGNPELKNDEIRKSVWRKYVELADKANAASDFTTLVGFEWTPTPNGNNLHRVVIFRDGKGVVDQVIPFASFTSEDPEDLWKYLDGYHRLTGGEVFAIPHNSNGSNGLMFPSKREGGGALTREYTRERRRWEPLVEVTQIKGDSETHPLLSPDDEFADFATWDKGNVIVTAPKERWMLKHEYARSALKLGLIIQQKTGFNPYQFGMVGGTDSHTSLATADDDNFWGGNADNEPSEERMTKVLIPSTVDPSLDIKVAEQEAAGYTAVWALRNSREEIFDALQRKEVYASTGPRIQLRFFGGWNFEEEHLTAPDYVRIGYEEGVPMGGVLPPIKGKPRNPSFIMVALKDPYGANLDRMQVIKGWLSEDGKLQEKVYNVAWSGKRALDSRGALPPLPSTVDTKNAEYRNTIGAVQLAATWHDPDFDPQQSAFYYVRVLEITTPRWVVYDRMHFNTTIPKGVGELHQERAYSSPIWYSPELSGVNNRLD